jgi:hypothetical protein
MTNEPRTFAERLDAAENGTQFGNVLMDLIATLEANRNDLIATLEANRTNTTKEK